MNKHVTERIDMAVLAANPTEVLSRLQAEGLTYEITQNGKVVAELKPTKRPPTSTEVDAALASGPRLDADDASDFLEVVDQIRREATLPERSPWD